MRQKRPGFLLWQLLFLVVIIALAVALGWFFFAQRRQSASWHQFIHPESRTFGSDW